MNFAEIFFLLLLLFRFILLEIHQQSWRIKTIDRRISFESSKAFQFVKKERYFVFHWDSISTSKSFVWIKRFSSKRSFLCVLIIDKEKPRFLMRVLRQCWGLNFHINKERAEIEDTWAWKANPLHIRPRYQRIYLNLRLLKFQQTKKIKPTISNSLHNFVYCSCYFIENIYSILKRNDMN